MNTLLLNTDRLAELKSQFATRYVTRAFVIETLEKAIELYTFDIDEAIARSEDITQFALVRSANSLQAERLIDSRNQAISLLNRSIELYLASYKLPLFDDDDLDLTDEEIDQANQYDNICYEIGNIRDFVTEAYPGAQ